jgi:lipopolysaccharide assembly protein A
MQFLKTLIWVTVIVGLTVFAANNWVPVTVRLWGGLLLDTKMPVLVIGSFIVGFLPLYLWHRGVHWRMKRRILSLETSSVRPPLDLGRENIAPPMNSTNGIPA